MELESLHGYTKDMKNETKAKTLYNPENEHDSCGIAMVATLSRKPKHQIVKDALTALENMEHRGAVGADINTGDGAGILTQIPHEFFKKEVSFSLPDKGKYATGMVFLSKKIEEENLQIKYIENTIKMENLQILGWREVKTNPNIIGETARQSMPRFRQIFLIPKNNSNIELNESCKEFEYAIYRFRKKMQNKFDIYFPSLSTKTIVYKGMLTTEQLKPFYQDLNDEHYTSKFAIVHSRFSTNTFPAWSLAQPFRTLAHNGEFNTVRSNRRWAEARQSKMSHPLLGKHPEEMFPICSKNASDSASLDEVAELIALSGRSLPHALMMMIPEAWENDRNMEHKRRKFYAYHSLLMEPWEGSACVSFNDGDTVGAVLDRNGLRPGRYWVTDQDTVIFASEVGVVPLPRGVKVIKKSRIKPGQMLAIDTVKGKILNDSDIKEDIINLNPWEEWLQDSLTEIKDTFVPEIIDKENLSNKHRVFGYTTEEIKLNIETAATLGEEPIASMGHDMPIAAISKSPQLIFDYFTQQFAQITNPPLDSIREKLVTSLGVRLGAENNILDSKKISSKRIIIKNPVIDNLELAKILHAKDESGKKIAAKFNGTYKIDDTTTDLKESLENLCKSIDNIIDTGISILVLSNRNYDKNHAPIPSLLLSSTVHNHLIRSGKRLNISIVAEAGDAREAHHIATLLGYGASAVNPYVALDTVEHLVNIKSISNIDTEQAKNNFIKALSTGLLRIMSKVGISTVSSYRGAQTFEAVGLSRKFVNQYFQATYSALGGVGIEGIERETYDRHIKAYDCEENINHIEASEEVKHLFSSEAVNLLQLATRKNDYKIFKQYSDMINNQDETLMTLRGMLTFDKGIRKSIDIDKVESVANIVKRFVVSAMSYGSLSREVHETLATAMNYLGAKSNSGEGGEEFVRLWDEKTNSAIKQVASGRFGVTNLYLNKASDIEIKIAQGAKPGEGGYLMSKKMYPWISSTRYSIPGVSLISPPSHHDIYSIEDLSQLIYDLKSTNPKARIQIKLVSGSGIGTIAAGAVKAKADSILISGHDGGTGASPLNSIKHAGIPWEIGLAETQQTLRLNKLRDRVILQVDGQMKTGRDVIVAAILGAEEFGFATAPLVASGCVMSRVCHLDTCPTGIATQNPELRKNFIGKVAHIVTFFEFIAQEVREILADLGYETLNDLVGRTEILDVSKENSNWKANMLDLSYITSSPSALNKQPVRNLHTQEHKMIQHFDNRIIDSIKNVFDNPIETVKEILPISLDFLASNTDLSIGSLLGHEVTNSFAPEYLPDNSIKINLSGSAGQSLGAFLPPGISLFLAGDANDYVGKGLSGGIISIKAETQIADIAEDNVIAGNVIGYGATSGEIFLNGQVGERFLVRNSGATAVAEGIGDHGCEYMTGGVAVILGEIGRNFGAGMSGGTAYLIDFDIRKINQEALDNKDFLIQNLDSKDEELLFILLNKHLQCTDSLLCKNLLDDFSSTIKRFTKLLPKNYSDILEITNRAISQNKYPYSLEVWQEILALQNN